MKVIKFPYTIFLAFLISCSNSTEPENYNYVSKINMEQFQKEILPEYELVRKRGRREGREYVFASWTDSTRKNIFIRVGIHPTNEYVKKLVDEYNSSLMIIPQEDSTIAIGDRLWWMSSPVSPDTVSFQFIRNNVFVIVNSHTLEYYELLNLTRTFDEAILNERSFITLSNSSQPPIIKSISATRLKIKEGEETSIIVNAYDAENEDLEYLSQGVFQITSNEFKFIASRDYVSEPFIGKHILEFYVINESNFVSGMKEIEIEITN